MVIPNKDSHPVTISQEEDNMPTMQELQENGISMAARDARFWARDWKEYLYLLDKGLDTYGLA